MTLLDTYNGFIGALATGQLDQLPTFVDPDAYTEDCVGFTGWTQGLDVALANFQFGIGAAFADLAMDVRDILDSPGSLVIRAQVSATHAGRSSASTPPAAGWCRTRSTWSNPGRTGGSLGVQPQRPGRRPPPTAGRTRRIRGPRARHPDPVARRHPDPLGRIVGPDHHGPPGVPAAA